MSEPELDAVYDEIAKCNKCGFCQAACPVYRVTGKEMLVARGHYDQIREVVEGRMELTPRLQEPLFDCLLCKACTANCPPAVDIALVMSAARSTLSRRHGRSLVQRVLLQSVLPRPGVLALGARAGAVGVRSGLGRLAASAGLLGLVNRDLPRSQALFADLPLKPLTSRVSKDKLRPREARRQVAYFNSCGFNYLLPQVGEATIRVLTRNGCEVELLPNNCCGLPAYAYGDLETARQLARKNIDLFRKANVETVVTDCGSCSSFLKEYARLLAGDPEYAEAARTFSTRVRDINQFLAEDLELTDSMRNVEGKLTYHDPCHLSRYQKITAQPRALLKRIPGSAFQELPEADWCCGAAGTFNLTHYDQSMSILGRKVDRIGSTGATTVVTSCPSCMLQLGHGVRSKGLNVKVKHVTQVLDEAYPPG